MIVTQSSDSRGLSSCKHFHFSPCYFFPNVDFQEIIKKKLSYALLAKMDFIYSNKIISLKITKLSVPVFISYIGGTISKFLFLLNLQYILRIILIFL